MNKKCKQLALNVNHKNWVQNLGAVSLFAVCFWQQITSSLAVLWGFLSPEQALKEAGEDNIGLLSVWNPLSTLTLSRC